jgi:hypothetical protein
MQRVQSKERSVRELLQQKYTIDYYQREYRWEAKQMQELIDDLTGSFLAAHEDGKPRVAVKNYARYFLGSIIISRKDNANYIVDGQQRLTSLTLVLIYLNHLQASSTNHVNVDDLIFSEQFGVKSFNLEVPERTEAMRALYAGESISIKDQLEESVRNILARYEDIQKGFPEDIDESRLPYFLDWLIENVDLVEISASSDDDAYTIFETMNDRGLSLSPTDMLKGYLLTNIVDAQERNSANDVWRKRTTKLRNIGREDDFFKSWLRSQYAQTIVPQTKGVQPGDFDRIGSEFHRWVRQHSDESGDDDLVLKGPEAYFTFIDRDFRYYADEYLRLVDASSRLVDGLEHIYYNARHNFTLQYTLLLAPLCPMDSESDHDTKLRLVGMYIDILLARRIWNFRSISQATMHDSVFRVTREIRGLGPVALASYLHQGLSDEPMTFATNPNLYVHQQNRYRLHQLLARITDYVERESKVSPSRYLAYVTEKKNPYEVEHIWADHAEKHTDEFSHPADFEAYRNRIGGLLLIPKGDNSSFGDLPYSKKLPHYLKQNLLAQSLHPDCYERNPGFKRFIEESGLPFRPHTEFKKVDIDARGDLYRQIAERIWDPDQLLREVDVS